MANEPKLYRLEDMPYRKGILNLIVPGALGGPQTLSLRRADLVEICRGVLRELREPPEVDAQQAQGVG